MSTLTFSHPDSIDLMHAIAAKVFADTGCDPFHIEFSWNKRMTRTAGMARLTTFEIDLSAKTFAVIDDAERVDIVIHEVCHLIAYSIYGLSIAGHGHEWKALMRKAGGKPIRYLGASTSKKMDAVVTVRRYEYACRGCSAKSYIRATDHKRFQRYYSQVVCNGCNGSVVLTSKKAVTMTRASLMLHEKRRT